MSYVREADKVVYVNLLRMWSQDWKKPHQPHHHQRPHWSKKKNQLTWPPRFEYFAGYLNGFSFMILQDSPKMGFLHHLLGTSMNNTLPLCLHFALIVLLWTTGFFSPYVPCILLCKVGPQSTVHLFTNISIFSTWACVSCSSTSGRRTT